MEEGITKKKDEFKTKLKMGCGGVGVGEPGQVGGKNEYGNTLHEYIIYKE